MNFDETYEKIKNYANDFEKSRAIITRIIEEDSSKYLALREYGINPDVGDNTINEMKISYLNDLIVLEYTLLDYSKKNETKVVTLIKNDLPVFTMENCVRCNNDIICSYNKYIVYQENNNHIDRYIIEKKIVNEAYLASSITILNSDLRTNTYNRIKYDYTYNNGKAKSIISGKNMFLSGEIGFEQVYNSSIRMIDSTFKYINSIVDGILDNDLVKIYQIRKNNK